MSNALAIAAVSAVLMDLLNNAVIDHKLSATIGGDINITAQPPDKVNVGRTSETSSQLNLFLYRVSPNAGWRNVGLPSHSAESGERLTNPPLALDLHYLLTAFGKKDLEAEILLGYAMQRLHEMAVMVRADIRTTLKTPSPVSGSILPAPFQALAASDLADQVEQIRITPEYLDNEEMSRIWSPLETGYRLSMGYLVTVVLIESKLSTRPTLPVLSVNLYAEQLYQPLIESIESAKGSMQPVTADAGLVIRGQRLQGREGTRVLLGEQVVFPPADQVSPTRIQVTIPAGLRAGVQGVQVAHERQLGTPPQPHGGVESNAVAYVLHPVIQKDSVTHLYLIDTTGVTVAAGKAAGTIKVTLLPAVVREQRVELLLNGIRAYSFAMDVWPDPPPAELNEINFTIKDVDAGSYLLRVQVDGADSPLDVSGGVYSGPSVNLT